MTLASIWCRSHSERRALNSGIAQLVEGGVQGVAVVHVLCSGVVLQPLDDRVVTILVFLNIIVLLGEVLPVGFFVREVEVLIPALPRVLVDRTRDGCLLVIHAFAGVEGAKPRAIEPCGVSPQPPQPPQPYPPNPYWARAVPPVTERIRTNPSGIRIHRSIVNLLAAERERRPAS